MPAHAQSSSGRELRGRRTRHMRRGRIRRPKQVVMGYFGVQSLGTDMQGKACAALRISCRASGRPTDRDIMIWRTMWMRRDTTTWWRLPIGAIRQALRAGGSTRWPTRGGSPTKRLAMVSAAYREIACPRVERYETLFNTPDRPEGVSVVRAA